MENKLSRYEMHDEIKIFICECCALLEILENFYFFFYFFLVKNVNELFLHS